MITRKEIKRKGIYKGAPIELETCSGEKELHYFVELSRGRLYLRSPAEDWQNKQLLAETIKRVSLLKRVN